MIVQDNTLNAFVAGGQRIFINTGLIMRTETPNQLIGVLAHESGHIAGGHLARMQEELRALTTLQILEMILATGAMAGGSPSCSAPASRPRARSSSCACCSGKSAWRSASATPTCRPIR